jgi:hypothetical protein
MAGPRHSDISALVTSITAHIAAVGDLASAFDAMATQKAAVEAAVRANNNTPISANVSGTEYIGYVDADNVFQFVEAQRLEAVP